MTLAHADIGSGPVIVLLHGWSLDGSTWHPQAELLTARGYRVVIPDLPGHGRSRTAEHDPSFAAMPEAVLDLLVQLGVDRAIVVGLSMGSALAVELALAAPELVAGLLLADNAASDSDPVRAAAAAERVLTSSPSDLAAWYAPLLFSARFRQDQPLAVASWERQFLANDREAIAAVVLGYHVRRDVRPLLGTLDVPTTVVFGSEDATTPDERRHDYESIPGARRHDLAGAGHLANVEQPEAFTHLVLDLAARVPGFGPVREETA